MLPLERIDVSDQQSRLVVAKNAGKIVITIEPTTATKAYL